MITLEFTTISKPNSLRVGNVVHLRIIGEVSVFPGRWRLVVEDVTPLPGAEPTGYACHICGIIEEAKDDGSLPDGWTVKKYEEGSCFICSSSVCQLQPICRICGCTNDNPCRDPKCPTDLCFWVEPGLCSACVREDAFDKPGHNEFHAHLGVCSQCRNHSFGLCPTGAKLLKETVSHGSTKAEEAKG